MSSFSRVPNVAFRENHWLNESTMLLYLNSYIESTRHKLGLNDNLFALVTFDRFNAQYTEKEFYVSLLIKIIMYM